MPRLLFLLCKRASLHEKGVKAGRGSRRQEQGESRPHMANTTEFDLGMTDLFIAKMLDADRDGALAFVSRSLDDGASLEAVVTGLLAPALVDLGRRWAAA